MQIEASLSLGLPIAALAVSLAAGVLFGLKLLERSLIRARLCKPDFHLGRRLFPASAALIVSLAARSLAAALQLHSAVALQAALSLAVVWSAAYLMIRVIWVLTQLFFHRFEIDGEDNLRSRRVRTQLGFIEKVGYVAIIFLGACSTLLLFDGARRFGESMLASAGVAGIIIGLAAQKSLSNLIAGFQIAFTQPLRLEDVVVVEGEWGWVEEINLTYVVIRIWDRRRLILPITYFVEKPFQNWTRTTSQIIGAVTLEVSHQVPFAELEKELFRLLDETPLWDRDVRVLQMVEVRERNVSLRALMTARDSPKCWDLRCFVRRHLVEFLQTNYPESLPVVRIEQGDHAEQPTVTRFESGSALTASRSR